MKRFFRQIAFALLAVVAVVMVTVFQAPRVQSFSWENSVVTWRDREFVLSFSRAVDPVSVEENLTIEPPLPGRWEWDGKQGTYILDRPAPYGLEYELTLSGVQLASRNNSSDEIDSTENKTVEDPFFSASFRSSDRAIVYIGTESDEQGALVFYNFTQDERRILTPPDLSVLTYRLYPQGDRILFSAIDQSRADARVRDVQIYTVTTGKDGEPSGRIDRLLDSQDYQNLQFDLSLDGSVVVAQRADLRNPGANFGLWVLRDGEEPAQLETDPGGMFSVAPNGRALALALREGVAILPLDPGTDAREPAAFFRDFGRALAFSNSGQKLALLKFNPDYTRSIFLSTDLGEPQELLSVRGAISDVRFDPTGELLYFLLLAELDVETYLEQPRLVAIDLNTGESMEFASFNPAQRDLQFDLSPDGQAIVFDRLQTESGSGSGDADNAPRTSSGERITDGELQAIVPLLPLVSSDADSDVSVTVESLGRAGIRPRWVP